MARLAGSTQTIEGIKTRVADNNEQPKETSVPFLQGPGSNALTSASTKQMEINPFDNTGLIETPSAVRILIANADNTKMSVISHKVYDKLVMLLTKQIPNKAMTEKQILDNRIVILTLKDYMQSTGIKDRKEAMRQMREGINTLSNIWLEFSEERLVPVPNAKGKAKERKEMVHFKLRITDSLATWGRGNVAFSFSYDMAKYLTWSYVMQRPMNLLKINSKTNPHSYYLGKKLCEHVNMNDKKANRNIISVKTLLSCCPDIPLYENLAEVGAIDRRIINPFERDLDALASEEYGIIESWEYCNKGGEPLTTEQAALKDYRTFIDLEIKFYLKSHT